MAEPELDKRAGRGGPPVVLRPGLFMIVAAARTGSSMLANLIQSHPNVLCHMEIFNPARVEGFSGSYRARLAEEPDLEGRLRHLRGQHPEVFLYKIAFDAQGRRSVGFKFKYEELLLPQFAGARSALIADTDIRIVHLRRRNLLARYLSWWVVNNVTGVTMIRKGDPKLKLDPVPLDPEACRADIEHIERIGAFVGRMLAGHPAIEIDYEDLTGPAASEVEARLQEFLGLPQRPLTTVLDRLSEAPLSHRIANFRELERAFDGTRHAVHFDEEPA